MNRISSFVWCAVLLTDAALIAAALSGYGSRQGWWHFRAGFRILEYSVYAALLAAVLHGIALGRRKGGWRLSIAGLILSLGLAAVPIYWKRQAKSVPPIHDITTDTINPPVFVSLLEERQNSPNGLDYGGREIAAQQAQAYPDIQPLDLSLSAMDAFVRAFDTAQQMGWKIAGSDAAEGRIEATDTTYWFGFKDDISIRITPQGNGSRLDIRSISRVGKSDVGTNARRIRNFVRRISAL